MDAQRLVKCVQTSSLWVSPPELPGTALQDSDLATAGLDVAWYQRRHREVGRSRDVSAYINHYASNVRHTRASPNLAFDEEWYVHRYPAVRQALNAGDYRSGWDHYLRIGASEFLNPTPWFDERWYQAQNPEAQRGIQDRSLICGYEHYLMHGLSQDRAPSIYFNPKWYRETVMTGAERGSRAWALPHFLLQERGEAPVPFFDDGWYTKNYLSGDSSNQGNVNAFRHYLLWGRTLGHSPSPFFNEAAYRAAYPQLLKLLVSGTYLSGFEHYVSEGVLNGFVAPTHMGTSGVDYQGPEFRRNFETSVRIHFRRLASLRELQTEIAKIG